MLIRDALWAVVAATVVFVLICIHVQSFFIGAVAIWTILFSFPITLVLYRKVCGITNLGALHLAIVFVVLGISADNIFVIWDAWCQSAAYPAISQSKNQRMAYTFRRSSKAILATSSTTAFAFLSNGFSSLMPISAFGFFAFIVVPVNYILQVFYFPAFIILYGNIVKSYERAFCRGLTRCVTCYHCRRSSRTIDTSRLSKLAGNPTDSQDTPMQHTRVVDTAEVAPSAVWQGRSKETELTREAVAPESLRVRVEGKHLDEITNPQDERNKGKTGMLQEDEEQQEGQSNKSRDQLLPAKHQNNDSEYCMTVQYNTARPASEMYEYNTES